MAGPDKPPFEIFRARDAADYAAGGPMQASRYPTRKRPEWLR